MNLRPSTQWIAIGAVALLTLGCSSSSGGGRSDAASTSSTSDTTSAASDTESTAPDTANAPPDDTTTPGPSDQGGTPSQAQFEALCEATCTFTEKCGLDSLFPPPCVESCTATPPPSKECTELNTTLAVCLNSLPECPSNDDQEIPCAELAGAAAAAGCLE